VTAPAPTAEFASIVYGPAGVPLDDPAEAYHEASALYPGVAPARLETLLELGRNDALQQTVARASFARDQLPGIDLPPPALGNVPLTAVLETRRSRAPSAAATLGCATLASVLATAYASTNGRRPVPSGGALYPLELYAVALDVDRIEPGVHHYSPYRHRLARLGPVTRDDVAEALVDAELATATAAVVVVTAMFWRTRFKYGLRGYRFALLEAGHAMQNAVLAAAALGVQALPIGGFYDRVVDRLVGADSLDEASLYVLVLGGDA
jgi:SagB-type dehydrogenase family enzyme